MLETWWCCSICQSRWVVSLTFCRTEKEQESCRMSGSTWKCQTEITTVGKCHQQIVTFQKLYGARKSREVLENHGLSFHGTSGPQPVITINATVISSRACAWLHRFARMQSYCCSNPINVQLIPTDWIDKFAEAVRPSGWFFIYSLIILYLGLKLIIYTVRNKRLQNGIYSV